MVRLLRRIYSRLRGANRRLRNAGWRVYRHVRRRIHSLRQWRPWPLGLLYRTLCPMPQWPPPAGRVRRILISGQMGIGNLLLFTPLLRALREGYPQAHLAAVFWDRNGAEELLAASPYVDEVVLLETRSLPRYRRILAGIRLGWRGWDMVVIRFGGLQPEMVSAMV